MKSKKQVPQFNIGDIVISRAGHDKAKVFVIMNIVNEEFVLIADGQSRKLDSLKLKKAKHLILVFKSDAMSQKIMEATIADSDVRAELESLDKI